jgi:hypothetical protein
MRALEADNARMRVELGERYQLGQFVGTSGRMQDVYRLVRRVSATRISCLVCGESGTGKELLARAIHYGSDRSQQPFIPVNCGAIPDTLFESELFGYKKGAFTGAARDKVGMFEAADGGTLFLDEVGEMPLPAQVKVLRALAERKITPVGGTAELPVDAPGDALLRSAGVGGSAMRGDGLRAVVRVVNPSAQPTWTLYRNGLWSFEVTSPRGTSTSCAQLTRSAAPRRDYFVRLGARGQRATTVMPALWCPTGTFAEPGVYDVRALFESRADGEEFNLQRVFVGRVSSAPFALRVTRGDGRYRAWGPLRAP